MRVVVSVAALILADITIEKVLLLIITASVDCIRMIMALKAVIVI